MIYKTLISTDTFASAENLPHLILTATDRSSSFNEVNLQSRDNKYNDLAGVLVLKKDNLLSNDDVASMKNIVSLVNKNLVFLISAEYLSGWLFYKDSDEIQYKQIKAHTSNDVNFDVWLESQNSLWNPVDFLLEGAPISSVEFVDVNDIDDPFVDVNNLLFELKKSLDRIEGKIDSISKK